ncbi:helix-turn-helix transcriptional regulator [Nesterenkonia flava]
MAPAPVTSDAVEIRRGEEGPTLGFPWTRIRGEREQLQRDTEWLDHAHAAHELLWCLDGALTLATGQRLWTIAGSYGLWIPAGTRHSGTLPAGAVYRAAFFSTEHVPALAAEPTTVKITPLLGQLLDYIDQEGIGPSQRERAEAVVMDLLQPVPQEIILHIPHHELIAEAAAEILADPAAAHSVDHWTKRLNVSSRTITRTFRAETGVGFARWVATARARCAIALLAQGTSVAETAEQVGYATTSAFGVAFRRVTGLTPGSFRRERND